MPDNHHLHNWLDMARQRINSGPAAAASAGRAGDRDRLGLSFTRWWRRASSGADRHRRLISMPLGGQPTRGPKACAMAPRRLDWPLLKRSTQLRIVPPGSARTTAGGVGMGFSPHAGMFIVLRRTGGGAPHRGVLCNESPNRRPCAHSGFRYEDASTGAGKGAEALTLTPNASVLAPRHASTRYLFVEPCLQREETPRGLDCVVRGWGGRSRPSHLNAPGWR